MAVILKQASDTVRSGGVIAYPTEAVYGLGCDPWNEAAVRRILALKQRSVDQGLIVIAATVEQLVGLIAPLTAEISARVLPTWPGPVTWLVPATADCPRWLTGTHNTLAVRVTAHPLAAALCRAAGPLVSTSANPHDRPPARNAQTVRQYFPSGLDYVVEGEVDATARPSEIRMASSGEIIRPA